MNLRDNETVLAERISKLEQQIADLKHIIREWCPDADRHLDAFEKKHKGT